MEMSCQFGAHALHYPERTVASTDWDPGWAPEPIWTFWRRKKFHFLCTVRNRLLRPYTVTVVTVLSRLPYFALSAKYFSGEKLRKMRWTQLLVLIEEREGRTGCWWGHLKVRGPLEGLSSGKLKESRNRPGVPQRVPGGLASQISMTFGTWRRWGRQPHSPAAFTPRKCSWYSFSLGAESTPRPWYGRKEYVTEKSSDTTGNRSRDRPTSSAEPYPLRRPRPRPKFRGEDDIKRDLENI